MNKYWNKKFGFEFSYPEKDWEAREIGGQNPGVELLNRHYLENAPLIVVRVWFYHQWSDDYVVKSEGKMRWLDHPEYGKSLEAYFKEKDFVVDFLLTGKFDEIVKKEFAKIVESFRMKMRKKLVG